jgi:predicted LPLAT superfamily acyltransferase
MIERPTARPTERTPQENAALILRAQLDAKELLRRAEREQTNGAVAILLSLEEARRMAETMKAVAELKEREHLDLYGIGSRG